ncbi:hypothetical protein BC332_34852 [Capsicum chinense]|nr:hypothetical protein BC332_34852 [Capsicum chinense]
MKKLLSHENTKDELTDFLSQYLIKHASEHERKVVVSWRTTAKASHKSVEELASNHEEADTKIILHGKYVAENGCNALHIFSPDTDVFILALRRYLVLPQDTGIFMGVGMRRFVSLKPIFDSLGPLKAAALPGLHALSGCDTTGSFANKGKPSWWKCFLNCSNEALEALVNLGKSRSLSDEIIKTLEEFICQLIVAAVLMACPAQKCAFVTVI